MQINNPTVNSFDIKFSSEVGRPFVFMWKYDGKYREERNLIGWLIG